MLKKLLIILLLTAALATLLGCSASAEQSPAISSGQPPSPTESSESDVAGTAPSSGKKDQTDDESEEIETTSQPIPTEETRLSPDDWQQWPVIPELSPSMLQVYQQGLEQGNRDNAFSKVGDCQIIPDVFLAIFEDINYTLPERLDYLQGTINHFEGSFAREGYALKGGFVFPTVFSPLRADSSVCEPGETPYECELRVHQPTFVLISMEFRYDGRTVETHEMYLRKSVEYALARGIVPILATKADNFEGDHSLNRMTAQIAYEYDLPLWNYWRAVQILPDHGIDWDRDSYGFHVTPDAWNMRSETFLMVLDALYQQAKNSQ